MIFFQIYPRFTRFECKAFLAEAIAYFHGAAATCMVDFVPGHKIDLLCLVPFCGG